MACTYVDETWRCVRKILFTLRTLVTLAINAITSDIPKSQTQAFAVRKDERTAVEIVEVARYAA